MARKPLDVSVTLAPVRSRTSAAKTCTPAWRNWSSVSVLPEHARADHHVGLAADQGLQHALELGGVPLAVAVERDDEARAVLARELVATRSATPCPQLRSSRATWTPAARDTSLVPSVLPSSITSVAISTPQAAGGMSPGRP